MVKGWKPISFHEKLVEKLELVWKRDRRKPKDQKFGPWLNNLLSELSDYHEKLEHYGPFLEFSDAIDNRITLFDHRLNKSIAVFINGQRNELQCDLDDAVDCLHVGFCFGIPKIYKTLIEKGFRPPKKSKGT